MFTSINSHNSWINRVFSEAKFSNARVLSCRIATSCRAKLNLEIAVSFIIMNAELIVCYIRFLDSLLGSLKATRICLKRGICDVLFLLCVTNSIYNYLMIRNRVWIFQVATNINLKKKGEYRKYRFSTNHQLINRL